MQQTYILSLGGSMIVPPSGVNTRFLKAFTAMIRRRVKAGDRFVIITGGGSVAREYAQAAGKVTRLANEDLDWLGIHATRLNGHLMRTILRDIAHPVVVKNPSRFQAKSWDRPVLVGAGWRPGNSTDYIATCFARRLKASTVVNVSNIEYLYDKDPAKYKDAKKVKTMDWKTYRKMVGSKWVPGMNLPFDPVASKMAQKDGVKVVLVGGKSVANLEKVFAGAAYKGSTIEG